VRVHAAAVLGEVLISQPHLSKSSPHEQPIGTSHLEDEDEDDFPAHRRPELDRRISPFPPVGTESRPAIPRPDAVGSKPGGKSRIPPPSERTLPTRPSTRPVRTSPAPEYPLPPPSDVGKLQWTNFRRQFVHF
jgi:hypothetical protein